MKITVFADAEEVFGDAGKVSNFDRMWKRPLSAAYYLRWVYVVIGEAIRPRDILLAGDAHITKI